MQRKQLDDTLAELHERLSQADHVDPETVELLRALTGDIQRLLDKSEAPPTEEVGPISERLKDLLLEFEADHPQLSSAIGKVADALAAIGI